MNESLFHAYIAKFFPRLQTLVEKVNGKRDGQLSYLHKDTTILHREYSPDNKWESGSVDSRYVAADFVWEDEQWKVWHLLYVQDLDAPSGYDWTAGQPDLPADPAYAELASFHFPEPNVKMTVYETYSADRAFCAPPAYPEPYETFAETFSYGL